MRREGLKPKPLHGALKPFWQVKKGVMARYDMVAPSYDVRYGEEQSKKHEVALQTLGSFCGKMVLDEGCGTGLLLSKIAGYNTSIVGVDLSRGMLKRAVEELRPWKNVHFICCDADFLPLRENLFDCVFSHTLLQNMPKPKTTLDEVVRVSKGGSTLV
jgi:malonyl-CoA O-methyltransferase